MFVETNLLFNCFLFERVGFGDGIGIRFALIHKLRERIIHQATLVFEIAAGDGFAFGM